MVLHRTSGVLLPETLRLTTPLKQAAKCWRLKLLTPDSLENLQKFLRLLWIACPEPFSHSSKVSAVPRVLLFVETLNPEPLYNLQILNPKPKGVQSGVFFS